MRSLNEFIERTGRTFATQQTAMKAVEKAGTFGGSVAIMQRQSDQRHVVVIINPTDVGGCVHVGRFVAWT